MQRLREGDLSAWPDHRIIPSGRLDGLTATFDHLIWDGTARPITLLVNADFGMGDTIHFWRFIYQARRKVGHLVLRCDEELHTLFQDVELVSKDAPLPNFDEVIHMMALPKVLGIREVTGSPYLWPNPDYLPDHSDLLNIADLEFTKIGVCWSGNPYGPRDKIRSIPSDVITKLCYDPRIRFFNLHKFAASPNSSFWGMRKFMRDWNQTAYVISQMDLVISVETAVVVLAGAMSIPTWALIPKNPDWRFGGEEDDTIWYKHMRLFRQKTTWEECLDRVVKALKELE